MLDLLTDLVAKNGRTVVAVLHDLNLACRYADHIVAMREGRIIASGDPTKIVTASLVNEVFGIRAEVTTDPVSHTPMVVPVGRHKLRSDLKAAAE